jgi:hypothetical protein
VNSPRNSRRIIVFVLIKTTGRIKLLEFRVLTADAKAFHPGRKANYYSP